MKKVFTATLILMVILTVIYASAVVYANVNDDSHFIWAYVAYECDTSPTEWYTLEQLGIVSVEEVGENCLQIAVDERKEPFPLEEKKPIFLYKDKFYQVSSKGPLLVYAAYKYKKDTLPTEWYTPEELGIVEIWELNGAVQIVVDREKEPFPFGPYGTDDQPTRFLYKGQFYTVSHRWVTFADPIAMPWQIPIGGALGTGWIFTGVLFLKWRKKE